MWCQGHTYAAGPKHAHVTQRHLRTQSSSEVERKEGLYLSSEGRTREGGAKIRASNQATAAAATWYLALLLRRKPGSNEWAHLTRAPFHHPIALMRGGGASGKGEEKVRKKKATPSALSLALPTTSLRARGGDEEEKHRRLAATSVNFIKSGRGLTLPCGGVKKPSVPSGPSTLRSRLDAEFTRETEGKKHAARERKECGEGKKKKSTRNSCGEKHLKWKQVGEEQRARREHLLPSPCRGAQGRTAIV